MPSFPPRRFGALLLLATFIALAGCSGGGGGRNPGFAGAVAGSVVTLSGAPVADAAVTVVGTNLSTRTAFNGTYRLDNVPSGARTVRVTGTVNNATVTGQRQVILDQDVQEAQNWNIVVGPPNQKGVIQGFVRDLAGNPLPGAFVFVTSADFDPALAQYAIDIAETNNSGVYQFPELPAGRYILAATRAPFSSNGFGFTTQQTVTITLSTGETEGVNFSLAQASGAEPPAPTGLFAQAITISDPPVLASTDAAKVRRGYDSIKRYLQRQRNAKPAQTARAQAADPGSLIEVDLFWNPPNSGQLAGYIVQRAVGQNGGFATIDQFADPLANAYFSVRDDYTPNVLYRFRMAAVNSTGVQGDFSNTAQTSPFGKLDAVRPRTSTGDVGGNPSFVWARVTGVSSYQVFIYDEFPDTSIQPRYSGPVISGNSNTFLYPGAALPPGFYYWVVIGFNGTTISNSTAVTISEITEFRVQ
jgi:hypothetical protein